MVRIAGIDKDFSALELMFIQAEPEEKLEIATGYLAQLASEYGDLGIKIELENDEYFAIDVTKHKKVIKNDE